MSALEIRSFRPEDEAAVIDLWRRCGLVVPHNNPHKDIARKMKVRPDLPLSGTPRLGPGRGYHRWP